MTVSEKTAWNVLRATMWGTMGYGALSAVYAVSLLLKGGGIQLWMLIAVWLVWAGRMVLKRDDNWRKTLIVYCWFVIVFRLVFTPGSLIGEGTPGVCLVSKLAIPLVFLWSIWTLLVLYHPAVKRLCQKPSGE